MRIKITLESQKPIILPIGFNEIIQWFVYDSIRDEWLHDIGFVYDKSNFKLFCFSSILQKGKYLADRSRFVFPRRISFIVSSPVDWILEKLAMGAIFKEDINFGLNIVSISEISVLKPKDINKEEITVKALTPIEVHSTFEANGRKKTYYYTPFEKEFAHFLNRNAKKKWMSFYNRDAPSEIEINPIGFNKERIVRFGQNSRYVLVKGWTGNFKLKGDINFLKFLIDAGLGSRNSQGFGMVEVSNNA